MTKAELAGNADHVKRELERVVEEAVERVESCCRGGAAVRELELEVWKHLLSLGRVLLAYAFALRCLRSTTDELARRGLELGQVRLRSDSSYHATLMTTCGPVVFPLCAYRDDLGPGPAPVMRVPARQDVLPAYGRCRSSELCLEWETRLGAMMPFRKGQQALRYFTHGAVTLEDTTLARHMVRIGSAITRDWLYRTPDAIAEILETRATRDAETGRPILYVSSDAAALRRYVDETYAAQWKMANGIRLWCIDRQSGATIHLGGEYTFGDCQFVAEAIENLIATGHLPRDGRYRSVHAQIVFVTDGMPWLEERIINLFIDAIAILDVFHAIQHVAKYAAALYGKGTSRARKLIDHAWSLLVGPGLRPHRAKSPKLRRGHTKTRQAPNPLPPPPLPADRTLPAAALLAVIRDTKPKAKAARNLYAPLLSYIERNADRMDFPWFRSLGYQIGSGAMESLHRVAAQARLKLPGARWLRESAEAVFSLRMLALVEREAEFWSQPDLTRWLADAFAANANDAPHHEHEAA